MSKQLIAAIFAVLLFHAPIPVLADPDEIVDDDEFRKNQKNAKGEDKKVVQSEKDENNKRTNRER